MLESMKKLFGIFILLLFVSCGLGPKPIQDQPPAPTSGFYDLVWVDPHIVYSDTLVTVIAAKRIDSVYIENQDEQFAELSPSIAFSTAGTGCLAVVDLLSRSGLVLQQLFVKDLPLGYYQLSVNLDQLKKSDLPSGQYLIRSRTCSGSKQSGLTLVR